MKYVALMVVVGVVYFFIGRHTPVASVKEAVTASEAAPLTQGSRDSTPAGTNSLKRPLDRTHEVLNQVKSRNGDGEF